MVCVDDAQRWAQAQRRVDGLGEAGQLRAGRRALLPVLLSGLIAGLVGGVVSPLIRLLFHSSASDTSSGAQAVGLSAVFWIGLGITVAGLVLSTVVLIRALVTGRLLVVTSRVEAPLSLRQRRHVNRMLRGRERVGEAERTVARAIAEQRVQTFRALVPAYVCLGLVIIGVVVTFADIDVMLPLLFGALGPIAVLALVLDTAVHLRPARRFLEQHP